jgi:hypothetical protein
VLNKNVRIETSDALGDADAAYFVEPAQRIFMNAKQSGPLTQVFVAVDPNDPEGNGKRRPGWPVRRTRPRSGVASACTKNRPRNAALLTVIAAHGSTVREDHSLRNCSIPAGYVKFDSHKAERSVGLATAITS